MSFIGFEVSGPSEAEIKCADRGDGTAGVSYVSTAPGEYAVHVLCDDEDIPDSPFMAFISPNDNAVDPSKVRRT